VPALIHFSGGRANVSYPTVAFDGNDALVSWIHSDDEAGSSAYVDRGRSGLAKFRVGTGAAVVARPAIENVPK
jgi:hypothetical protein